MNKYQKALDNVIETYQELERRVGNNPDKVKDFDDIAILQELVDKETPMKPPLKWGRAKPQTRCKCSAGVEKYHNYCWNCGQRLDWSDYGE